MKERRTMSEDQLSTTGPHQRTWSGWLSQRGWKDWLIIGAIFIGPAQFTMTAVYEYSSSLFMADKHLVTQKILDKAIEPLQETLTTNHSIMVAVNNRTGKVEKVIEQILKNQSVIAGRNTSGTIPTPIKGMGAHSQ